MGKILMNCCKFVKFINIFHRQNFAPYGISLVTLEIWHSYNLAQEMGTSLLCLFFTCYTMYAAVLKILTHYAQYYANFIFISWC